jgi:hypothetical protein
VTPEAKLFQNLAVQGRVLEGMEGIRPADLGLRPRMLRLIHKVDRAEDVERGLKPGYLQIGNDPPVPGLEVVFLKAQIGRVLLEGDGPSARPTCGSADGREPYRFLAHPKSAECPPCEYSQWTTNPTNGKRIPPPCQRAVVFLGLEGVRSTTGPTPFWFVCKKTAFQVAQQFLADLQQSTAIGSLREVFVRIATERKTQPGGGVSYYVPVLTMSDHQPGNRNGLRKLFDLARDVQYAHGLEDAGSETEPESDEVIDVTPSPAGNGGTTDGIPF